MLALLLTGCTSPDRSSGDSPRTTSSQNAASAPVSSTPVVRGTSEIPRNAQQSAEAAVIALLEAERALDHRASFQLLSSVGLAAFPSPDLWARRRTELAPVTALGSASVSGDDVTVLVEHTATIDPFVGLQFAQERQTWHARNESGGWLVDPQPKVDPVVPPDAGAATATQEWTEAKRSCDEPAATALQAIATPLGISTGVAALCKAGGDASVGAPAPAVPGPETADLVAQYGSGVLRYVRSVRVSGLAKPFTVLLVPIGDAWRVLAVAD